MNILKGTQIYSLNIANTKIKQQRSIPPTSTSTTTTSSQKVAELPDNSNKILTYFWWYYAIFITQLLNLSDLFGKDITYQKTGKYILQFYKMSINDSSDSESESHHFRRRHEDSDINYFIYYHSQAAVEVSCTVNYHDQSQSHEQDESASHISYQRSSDLNESSERQSDFEQSSNQHHRPSQRYKQEPKGLSQEEIDLLPKMTWLDIHEIKDHGQQCTICINSFQINQKLRVLNCLHRFHRECVDKWLLNNKTCPSCRNSVTVPQ